MTTDPTRTDGAAPDYEYNYRKQMEASQMPPIKFQDYPAGLGQPFNPAAAAPVSTTANTDTPRSEDDEDAFNDWNVDIDNYVPTLWDAYLFGLSRGRSGLARDSARYKALAEKLARSLLESCSPNMAEGGRKTDALTEARAAGLLKETTP